MNSINTSLLPPPDIISPSKKSQLKTPPHSTQRISGFSTLENEPKKIVNNLTDYSVNSSFNDGYLSNHYVNNNDITSSSGHSNSKNHGLLSPEFSSPNLYEVPSSTDKSKNKPANININIISDSPLISKDNNNQTDDDNDNEDSSLIHPLQSPNYSKKRSLKETTSSNKKTKVMKVMKTPEDFILPEPFEMPEIVFESLEKPPYSYATLIGMALLRAPDRRLTLAEIYQWISDHFKFYKKGEVGWQNSIRHNLSLNKAFEKAEKSKEKKGHFWQIVSGFEHVYCQIKETKKSNAQITNTNTNSNTNNKVNKDKYKIPTTPKYNSYDTDVDDDGDDDKDDLNNNNENFTQLTPTNKNSCHNSSNLLTINKNVNQGHKRNISDTLGSIPELNIQYSSYANSRSFNTSPLPFYDFSPNISSNNSLSVDFTSSFSCRANFELSPLKPIEPGPLLEPLTPINYHNNNGNTATNGNKSKTLQLPSISKQLQQQHSQLQNKLFSDINHNISTPLSFSSKFRTPSRITSTPLNNINCPNSNYSQLSSVVKKLWASPSFLDDFYTSPISTSHSNQHSNNLNIGNSSLLTSSNNTTTTTNNNNNNNNNNNSNNNNNITTKTQHNLLINSIYGGSPVSSSKRRLVNKSGNLTNGYSTNEIFGIDVCTINHNDDDNE